MICMAQIQAALATYFSHDRTAEDAQATRFDWSHYPEALLKMAGKGSWKVPVEAADRAAREQQAAVNAALPFQSLQRDRIEEQSMAALGFASRLRARPEHNSQLHSAQRLQIHPVTCPSERDMAESLSECRFWTSITASKKPF